MAGFTAAQIGAILNTSGLKYQAVQYFNSVYKMGLTLASPIPRNMPFVMPKNLTLIQQAAAKAAWSKISHPYPAPVSTYWASQDIYDALIAEKFATPELQKQDSLDKIASSKSYQAQGGDAKALLGVAYTRYAQAVQAGAAPIPAISQEAVQYWTQIGVDSQTSGFVKLLNVIVPAVILAGAGMAVASAISGAGVANVASTVTQSPFTVDLNAPVLTGGAGSGQGLSVATLGTPLTPAQATNIAENLITSPITPAAPAPAAPAPAAPAPAVSAPVAPAPAVSAPVAPVATSAPTSLTQQAIDAGLNIAPSPVNLVQQTVATATQTPFVSQVSSIAETIGAAGSAVTTIASVAKAINQPAPAIKIAAPAAPASSSFNPVPILLALGLAAKVFY